MAQLTGASDSCSCSSRTDSFRCFAGQPWPERPQTLLFSSSVPSDAKGIALSSEPIYAESTKRKNRASVACPSQQCSALDGQLATDSLGAKDDAVNGNAVEPNGQVLYLTNTGSALNILSPHLHATSSKHSRCSSCQCCCSSRETNAETSTETNSGSLQSAPQVSPPIPPKRSSCSPNSESACLSPSPLPEGHLYPSVPTQVLCLSRNRSLGEFHTPIAAVVALERRNARHGAETEGEEAGGTVPRCGTPRSSNAAAVLEPRAWCPTVHCREGTPPRQLCLDRHKGSMFTIDSSSPAALPEGKSHEPGPPPPPPKKHHRSVLHLRMLIPHF